MPLPIPAPHASGQTTTTALPLYWAAYGVPGAPRALVLHGGPGADHQYLLPQMLRLGEGPAARELLFYDQRGGGRSKSDDRTPVTWRAHVDDLAAVARELIPASEPLTIVGYSWGGLLALLYTIEAARDPRLPRPQSLVLLDPAPVTRDYRREFEAEFARRQQGPAVQALREELAASGLRERDPDVYRQRAFELSVAGYFADPAHARDLTPFRVVGRVQQSVWESLGDEHGDFDLRPALERAFAALPALRTLVVHGREDPIPLASSTDVARAAGAELEVIENAGHVPYVEGAEALFPAIERFLEAN
ncbi:MAG: alpha/beta fold hydrolase [Gemmatimonadaceae bacterium]